MVADADEAEIPRIQRLPAAIRQAPAAPLPQRLPRPGARAAIRQPDAARAVAADAGAAHRGGGGPAQRHSTMANLACYPAMNVPNGFSAAGIPTNATFFARPFGEMELIALVKAYQDKAKHHLRKPVKMDE